jgi:tRNA(Ile)-lysidine synthase
MRDAFRRVLLNHRLVSPGDRVLVALSGGPDSVALLHLLRAAAADLSLSLCAAHLDHGIRPESGRDAAFVRRLCEETKIPLTVSRAEVPPLARKRKQGVEETAREVRRDFLRREAAEADCAVIAQGHHRGDQAETVMHRLLRGSGLSGLSAMRLKSGPFIRPLLPFPRERVLRFLAEEGYAFVEDASNQDPTYTRNRIRRTLLPLLETFNPRVEEHLARLSDRIALEEDFWRQEEERVLAALATVDNGGIELDRAGLAALHPALRARVLRRVLGEVRAGLHGVSSRHITALEALAVGNRPQADLHLPLAWAGVRYGRLLLRPVPPPPPAPFRFLMEAPGVFLLPGGGALRLSMEPSAKGEGPWSVEFDAARVRLPLTVRSFRPGDRFRPAGMEGRKKLKDFFIDAKVERERRRQLPLVVGDEILWVVGVRRCEGWRPAAGDSVWRLQATPAEDATIHL